MFRNRPHASDSPPSSLPRRASFQAARVFLTRAVLCFLFLCSGPAVAITGGVSVNEALEGGIPQLQETAAAVAEVTVPLVRLDGQGKVEALCSATLIHPSVVLTAAHCVFDGRSIVSGLFVLFDEGSGTVQRRKALDVIAHPVFVEMVKAAFNPQREDLRSFIRKRGEEVLMSDLALVLLHRPAPDSHATVEMVPSGFRDDRGIRKVIAGFGQVGSRTAITALSLRFADLRGNTRDYRGAVGGGAEIVMESYFRDGEKVNVCSGDSGGPVFAQMRGAAGLRQLAVTSAGDTACRQIGVFAPIDAQRASLRRMFDTLMRGEQGAGRNPF
jgi:secreted trypsin-like serine protease